MGDGWPTSSATAEGMDASELLAMEEAIAAGDVADPDAIAIARNGKLVYEWYADDSQRGLHDLRSATKSVTSLLVGMAVEAGAISSVDDSVSEYVSGGGDTFRAITLEHLLLMSSGLDCNDWVPASPGNEERMYRSDDWVSFVLGLPAARQPGEPATYCTGGVVLLGHVVARATGVRFDAFASTKLFEPLEVTQLAWDPTPEGGIDSGGHLQLRARDFLKLGQLVLSEGSWKGQQLVSADWIRLSTAAHTTLGDSQYGYLWWRNTFNIQGTPVETIFARGNGGQYLFVFPELSLTAAFTGSHYNQPEGDVPLELVGRFVLPATLQRPQSGGG